MADPNEAAAPADPEEPQHPPVDEAQQGAVFNVHSSSGPGGPPQGNRAGNPSFFSVDINRGSVCSDLDESDSRASTSQFGSGRNVVIQVCNIDEMTEEDFPDRKSDFTKTNEEVAEIIKQINSIVLFQGYEDEELKSVIQYVYKRKVVQGEVVIRQGEEGDAFYVIRSGKYECTATKGGKETKICTYDGSGYFGDLALIHHARRAATITALTAGELWVLNAVRYVWLKKRQAVRNAECFEQAIRQIPMFSNSLTNSLIGNLIDAIEVITLRKGSVICRQGEPGDAMFFILDGKVSVTVGGTEVCVMGANGFFGERALILDEGRAATCSAKSNVKLAKLPKESFELLIPDSVVEKMRQYVASTYSKTAPKK